MFQHHQTTEITTLSQIKQHKITQEYNIIENNSNLSFDTDLSDSQKVHTDLHKDTESDADLNNENKHEPVHFVKIETNCDDEYIDEETQDDPTDNKV